MPVRKAFDCGGDGNLAHVWGLVVFMTLNSLEFILCVNLLNEKNAKHFIEIYFFKIN